MHPYFPDDSAVKQNRSAAPRIDGSHFINEWQQDGINQGRLLRALRETQRNDVANKEALVWREIQVEGHDWPTVIGPVIVRMKAIARWRYENVIHDFLLTTVFLHNLLLQRSIKVIPKKSDIILFRTIGLFQTGHVPVLVQIRSAALVLLPTTYAGKTGNILKRAVLRNSLFRDTDREKVLVFTSDGQLLGIGRHGEKLGLLTTKELHCAQFRVLVEIPLYRQPGLVWCIDILQYALHHSPPYREIH